MRLIGQVTQKSNNAQEFSANKGCRTGREPAITNMKPDRSAQHCVRARRR